MNEPDEDQIQEIRKRIGSGLMWSGGIVAALIAMDRSGLSLLAMPAFWYRSRSLHLLICISLFVVGIIFDTGGRRASKPAEFLLTKGQFAFRQLALHRYGAAPQQLFL